MSGLQPKHIQVCCRIRGSETGEPTVSSFMNNDEARDNKSYEVVTSSGSFQMDYAFDNGDSQDCIFDRIVQPMLSDAFAGFNCSLFSYGQTGSGKTYTLIGNIAGGGPSVLENKDRGIIPRAAEQIFVKQASLDPQKVTCQVKLAILEVYQEQLKDLIVTGGSNNPSGSVSSQNPVVGVSQQVLRIREQIDGTVWVEGLTEVVVTNSPDFNKHLMNALKRRVVGAHAMNDTSSRSHFCCIVNVHQVYHATGVKINSKIHFIDLAGSEMVRKTDTTGVRFDEAKHINKSLSALGNVIYALSAPNKGDNGNAGGGANGAGVGTPSSKNGPTAKDSAIFSAVTTTAKAHIPYRDSKLTRLLQNSLGGNAKTVIILTISDAKKHLQETLSTLRFGARARQIVIKPVVNKSVLEDQAMLKKQFSKAVQENRHLQDLVAQLQAEVHALKHNTTNNNSSHTNNNIGVNNGSIHHKDSEGEAVCEICNNFLNLKLRKGTKYTPFDDNADTNTPISPTNRTHPTTNPITVTTKNKQPMFIDTNTDDSEYAAPEPLDRCAICGLSGTEAEKLQLYTGEALGEMFSCDGNCGHQFHVRCVGLLGEGGQYALPDGEWFCTECYTADSINASGAASAAGTPRASIGAQDMPNPILRQSSSEDLYHTMATDPTAIALQSSRIAPNKTPSSVLATIKQEYHTMRKERNRILAQWQQEKRIIEKYEVTRRIEQQKRDQELVNARDMIKQLENMVTQGEAQSERMQKLFDVMLKELQQSTASMASSSNTSNAIRNSADRLKWASLTVETLLEMPIDSISSAARSPHKSNGTNAPHSPSRLGHAGRSPKLEHHNSSPNLNSNPNSNVKASSAVSKLASEAVGPYANTSAGIPKPWMGKVRTGAHITGSTTQSESDKSADSAHSVTKTTENLTAPPRYTSDQPSAHTGNGPKHAAIAPVRRPSMSSVSADQRDNSGGGTVSSAADSVPNSRRSSFQSFSSEGTSPDTSQSSRKKLPDNLQQELRDGKSSGKSKFINPLKNRLKDLLRSVEAETDAFAEIRQKFKSREDERNLLRSSQGDR